MILAGGGTGGHIYPGIAIAQSLQSLAEQEGEEICVHFVGAYGGLEEKIVPREGYPLHLLRVGKLNYRGGWGSKLRTLLGLPKVFIQSMTLLLKLRPVAVLGLGGYASGPFVLVASFLRFKTFLWEPNAFPGLTNRILSLFVKKCFVVFQGATQALKARRVEKVGLPVRRQIAEISLPEELPSLEPLRVLVFGGSQGSVKINEAILSACEKIQAENLSIEIKHQVGVRNFKEIQKSYGERFSFVQVLEYIHDMPSALQWADVVICRGGASTMAELMAAGRPAIVIPLPTASDDHQRKNAEELVRAGAGEMILQKDLTGQILVEKIEKFSQSPSKRWQMGKNAKQMYVPRAARYMAEQLLGNS